MNRKFLSDPTFAGSGWLSWCSCPAPARPAADGPAPTPIATINQRLGRGINFGNILDAPSEGEWGLSLKPEYFEAIAKAGFNSVRLPVRWAPHAQGAPEFTIEPKYFERVDWAIDQATTRGLMIVLNIHHDEAAAERPRRSSSRVPPLSGSKSRPGTRTDPTNSSSNCSTSRTTR